MLFNSVEFFLFFPIVFSIYFIVNPKWRAILLLLSSYFFYMSWKPEYVLLIIFSTIVDYLVAIQIHKSIHIHKRKLWLVLSLLVNLGLLCYFKYFNFLAEACFGLLNYGVGQENVFTPLDILLPVGISFYTFQTLSYTVDIYRRKQEPERNLVRFALYVSFFPQLVAGPIERSTHLIPQFSNIEEVRFDYNRFAHGFKQSG
jgi:alginate O-acetyltransferase complex protein AlgI